MTWGFPARYAEPVADPEPQPGLVWNTTPCPRCGRVHPWRGRPKQLERLLRQLRRRCPACFVGRPQVRPDTPELAALFSQGWLRRRPNHGPEAA